MEENVEIVREHIEAFRRGDPHGALSHIDPYVVWDPSRVGILDVTVAYGHEEFSRTVRHYIGAFENYDFDAARLTDLGPGAVLALVTEEGRWHCAQHRHLAEPGDLEPFEETGRLRREQRAAEAEAIRKARERWEADTMLSEKAANGSVSAMVCLERALRPENQPPEDGEVGEAIDQILRKGE